jgi:cytochrome c553
MATNKQRMCFDPTVWIGSAVVAFGLLATEASAERGRVVADNAVWRAECGACHVAYPPFLLSAEQWRAHMASLKRHFGSDASVDAAAAAEIGAFLARGAGRDRGNAMATSEPPRITRTNWFVKEHRDVRATDWTSAAVKSASNCGACHQGADRGSFDEHAVRIPR